jgi:hypothetical protein
MVRFHDALSGAGALVTIGMTGVSNVALLAPKLTGDCDFCHTQKLQSEVACGWRIDFNLEFPDPNFTGHDFILAHFSFSFGPCAPRGEVEACRRRRTPRYYELIPNSAPPD